MKRHLLLVALLSFTISTSAQKDKFLSSKNKPGTVQADSSRRLSGVSKTVYLGPGYGLDYAGLGIKLEAYPSDWMSVFASAGTNFFDLGYNVGLSFKVLPESRVTPTVQGMYGYNGVLVIKDMASNSVSSSKNFYGFSAGAGVDFTVGRNLNKIAVGLWAPFRSSEFKEDIKRTNATALPVAFSLGIKFGFI